MNSIPSGKMVLRIRLARFGNKHNPFFNIIVAQARYVVPLTLGHARPAPEPDNQNPV